MCMRLNTFKVTRSKPTVWALYPALIVHQLSVLLSAVVIVFFFQAACAIWQVFTLPCAQGGTQPACVTQPQELVLACPMCWVAHVTSVPLATGTWLAEKDVRPVAVIQKTPKATSATRQENYYVFQEPGCWSFDVAKWGPSYKWGLWFCHIPWKQKILWKFVVDAITLWVIKPKVLFW